MKLDNIKLDTSKDRLHAVRKLFIHGERVDNFFRRDPSRVSFGNILGLMVMLEKLTALEDLIGTEIILEGSLCKMLDVKDEGTATREKFVSVFGGGVEIFLKEILIKRLENMIAFANNNFSDRRLNNFQTDFRETLTALRNRYKEIYNF